MDHLQSSISGGLLGAAAGDALGSTVEFMRAPRIRDLYGIHKDIAGGGAMRWRVGQGTDDTDLLWAITESYIDTIQGHDLLGGTATRFVAWYRAGPLDIGGTTALAMERLSVTGDPLTSGVSEVQHCGNGSLMRTLPTALCRADPVVRHQESISISAITHARLECTDSCLAYNEMAAAFLCGASPDQAIRQAQKLSLTEQVKDVLYVDADTPVEALNTGGYVLDTLRCAVWAIQQDASAEDTLVALVNRGGDADTTGCVAGGLLGVWQGHESIPARWVDLLEYKDQLLGAVPTLCALYLEGVPEPF